jgi:hypothetical protein
MGSLLLTVYFLYGLQIEHAFYAEELTQNFSYCVKEYNDPFADGNVRICFNFTKTFDNPIKVRACVPNTCADFTKELAETCVDYVNYLIDYQEGTKYCIWVWKHQLKTMKLSINIWQDDELVIQIKE